MAVTERGLESRNSNDDPQREKEVVPKDVTLAAISDSNEDLESIYGVNEKALLRKLDFKLLPALTLLYLLSFLDRSNGTQQEDHVIDFIAC